jgi:hypothetical protein
MKLITTSLILSLLTIKGFSQIGLSYFPFQSLLSINTNYKKTFWADCKIETNTFFSNLNTEFSAKYNVKKQKSVIYYIGIGISINPANTFNDLKLTNGYFIDIGARVNPIKALEKFQIVFEISPYVNQVLAGGNLRTRLGVGYEF